MRDIPETCENCLFYPMCDNMLAIVRAGKDKCANWILEDSIRLCQICDNQMCYDFGKCKPVQEELNLGGVLYV